MAHVKKSFRQALNIVNDQIDTEHAAKWFYATFNHIILYNICQYILFYPHADSDIDIAVISKQLSPQLKDITYLLRKAHEVTTGSGRWILEPHPFHPRDFESQTNPLAYEIKRTGIKMV